MYGGKKWCASAVCRNPIVSVLPRSCTSVTRTHVHEHVHYHWSPVWTRHAHARLPKPGDNNSIFSTIFFSRRKYRKFQIDMISFLIFIVPFLFLNLSFNFENQGKNAGNVTKHAATDMYFELCFFCLAQIKMPSNKIFFIFQSKI